MSYKALEWVMHLCMAAFVGGLCAVLYGIWSMAFPVNANAEPAPQVQHHQRVYRITAYSMTGAKIREWRSLSLPQGSLNFGKSFLDLDTGEKVIFNSPYTAEIETR
jgi:hypothetical protein